MKLRFVFVQSSKERWFTNALELYNKKINGFTRFEIKPLKAKSLARSNSDEKKQKESELLLNEVGDKDLVILFDENGEHFKNSRAFAEAFQKCQQSGRQSITFVIAGAYGASEELKRAADKTWSLSSLTMNHMLASTVALEQIYRACTIQKNIPYHND